MGSAMPSTAAEIFLQYSEYLTIKHWMETGETVCYNKYVDDILIIFYHKKTKENQTDVYINLLHRHLEFKLMQEENGRINCLDQHTNDVTTAIYRTSTKYRHNHRLYFEPPHGT
jgi:hypothetical protein